MPIATLIPLLLQYGIPFTEYIITLFHKGAVVGPEEWAQIKVLANVTAREELLERLKANGVDPESEKGKTLLKLVP